MFVALVVHSSLCVSHLVDDWHDELCKLKFQEIRGKYWAGRWARAGKIWSIEVVEEGVEVEKLGPRWSVTSSWRCSPLRVLVVLIIAGCSETMTRTSSSRSSARLKLAKFGKVGHAISKLYTKDAVEREPSMVPRILGRRRWWWNESKQLVFTILCLKRWQPAWKVLRHPTWLGTERAIEALAQSRREKYGLIWLLCKSLLPQMFGFHCSAYLKAS